MKLNQQTIEQLAEHLENAELQAFEVVKITEAHPDMDWDDAYAIQAEILRRKLARGNRVVGLKAGLTSRGKMKQMGVDTPVFGWLVDYFSVPDGGEIKTSELIHPKVEPEIVFVTKRALKGPGCHIGAVLAATDFVMPGIEIIDSRYKDFKFDLKSVIADNCSSTRFVLGGQAAPVAGLDLRTLGVVLEKNGEVISTSTGAVSHRPVKGTPSLSATAAMSLRSSGVLWTASTMTLWPAARSWAAARSCTPPAAPPTPAASAWRRRGSS